MKSLLFTMACIILGGKVFSQEISIYGNHSLWHADNLCDIEFTGCDWLSLHQGSMLGYAYHPNGSLWLVLYEPIGDYNKIRIYEVTIESCQYALLYTISLPYYWSCLNAVNIDYLGRVYLNITEYDSLTNISTKTLSRIPNPAQPTFERLFVYFPGQNIYEVHFSKNKVYIPEIRKPFIYVLDTNYVLLDTIIMQKHIWGLTEISYGCDSLVTYAAHLSISSQEVSDGIKDTTMYISEYDLEANVLNPICSYWMGVNRANTQLTSPLEFLSSDPECDLLIDLDRDNSTGVYPYDYRDSTEYCSTLLAPICDPDVYIHTSAPLDSIVLILSGVQEPGDERLVLSAWPPGIMFNQRSVGTYVLTSTNLTDDSYKAAILALRYQHDGIQRTPGTRIIKLQGFNAIKDGVKITATIHINGLPFAGTDATLLICTDTLIQQLSAITGGQTGGYWWPSLFTGIDTFDSKSDVASQYQYIVVDPVCGADTAVVTIARDSNVPVDLLGADQVLCQGDTIDLRVQQSAISLLWDDGTTGDSRELTTSGDFWVAVESIGGCIYRDSIHIAQGTVWSPIITTREPICGKSNGQLIIDPTAFEQNGSVLVNSIPMVSPTLSLLPEGSYQVTSISNDGCESLAMVTLTDQPFIDVSVDTVITVTHGLWKTLEYQSQNHVGVADILIQPDVAAHWTGSAIEVHGDQDRTYEITFVDANGCADIHILHVKVEQEEGIYLPNIFNPGSTNGNDVWKPSISESYNLEVLRIYDRWGSMVHQSTTDPSWEGARDGQDCPPGVYVYQLILKHLIDGAQVMMTGDVTLIR